MMVCEVPLTFAKHDTDMSLGMKETYPAFSICENKDEADQRLCFWLMDSAIPLLA